MSVSLFNVLSPHSSVGAPEGAIEVILDEQSQTWFKRSHVGKFLDIKHCDISEKVSISVNSALGLS